MQETNWWEKIIYLLHYALSSGNNPKLPLRTVQRLYQSFTEHSRLHHLAVKSHLGCNNVCCIWNYCKHPGNKVRTHHLPLLESCWEGSFTFKKLCPLLLSRTHYNHGLFCHQVLHHKYPNWKLSLAKYLIIQKESTPIMESELCFTASKTSQRTDSKKRWASILVSKNQLLTYCQPAAAAALFTCSFTLPRVKLIIP